MREAETSGTCPICGKPADVRFRPFCSKRCGDIDLQRWFTDRYAIPAGDGDPEIPDLAGQPDEV